MNFDKTRQIFVAHYHEIGLKGGNRSFFENKLRRNIAIILGLAPAKISLVSSRYIIESENAEIGERLRFVFGISSFSSGILVKNTIEAIGEAVETLARDSSFKSFAIRTTRADKKFSLKSPEINRIIGERIRKKTGAEVDLANPQITIRIEVLSGAALILKDKIIGPGGLPVGTEAKTAVLISGGIDSPVAAWRILRRGSPICGIHFHSYPFTSRASTEKVREIMRVLNNYALRSRLYLVPFASAQKEILKLCAPKYRVLLYRRLMMRIASAIAEKEGALALATGESIGQVASQTIENLVVTNAASTLPIFRPLIGYDKEEIIAEARKIGTYDISILPHDDCCTLFIPRHPATKARLEAVLKEEQKLPSDQLVKEALAQSTREDFV